MESRKAAAGLSINRMLEADAPASMELERSIMIHPTLEAPLQLSQMVMPSSAVRVKPVLEAPNQFNPIQSQMAAPSLRVKPILQDSTPSPFQALPLPDLSISNICRPTLRVAPVMQSQEPLVQQNPFSTNLDPFTQQTPLQQYQAPVPQVVIKPDRPARPTRNAQELLSALKLWSTSLSPPDTKASPNPASSDSLVNYAADALSHASNLICLMTNKQIQKELKSLQELLDAGFIQPIEFENRRFKLQAMSKNALPEVVVPHVDANRALAPMTSVSSTTSGAHMASTSSRKHIRIFISSTFKDMSDERDTLMKNVIPQLSRELKKKGVVLTAVDLRWGITSEQTNSGNTVNICLSEIDRSQYFLCMLGSRYGWAQPLSAPPVDLGSAITASGQDELLKTSMKLALPSYPWIRSYAQSSVTELEVRHAVLNRLDSNLAHRSVFMMRAGAVDEDPRLTTLKQDIGNAGCAQRKYRTASTDDFGASVLNALLTMISADFPDTGPTESESPVQLERVPHQAFEDSRCRFFVPRESDFQMLDSHLASATAKPVAIVAAEGLGKSAFLSNFAARYRNAHPERLLITHYVGCTAASTDLTNLLKRMIGELSFYANATATTSSEGSKQAQDAELPTDMAGLIDKFIELLTVAGARYGGGVTIIVDAINQLTTFATTHEWIPAVLPPGVSIILSAATSNQQAMKTLEKVGAVKIQLTPLSSSEREAFIQGFMSLHSKTLKPSQLAAIVQSTACENPLFLRTLLEELRVFGSFEQLDARIESYLKAADPTSLFKLVLERLEKSTADIKPAGVIGKVLTALYVSRNGMTEAELVKMFALPQNVWSQISLALEELLVDSSGSLTFFHDCVRRAVENYHLSTRNGSLNTNSVAELHQTLAEFFAANPPSDTNDPSKTRFYEELPYHYERAESWESLLKFITEAKHFLELEKPLFRFDLYRYWRALPPHLNRQSHTVLISSVSNFASSMSGSEASKDAVLDTAALFFKDLGLYQPAEDVYKMALSRRKLQAGNVDDEKKMADRLEKLGYVLRLAGKYADASKVYRLSLDSKRKLYKNQDSAFLATSINSLAILCRKQGNYEEASKLYHEALEMRKRLFGSVHVDIAQSYNSLGCLFQDQGKYAEAAKMLEEAVRQRETLLGKAHPDVAMSLLNLGNVFLDWSRFTDAEPIYERSLAIYEATFGPEHPNVALVLNSFGGLYQEMGQFEKAIPMYVRNLETKIKMIGEKHPDLALAYNDIAVLCSRKDNNALAEDFFNGALEIRKTVLGERHPDFAQSLQNLGSIYQQEGRYGMALPLFKRALDINEGSFGGRHPNVASALTSIGGLLQLMGPSRYQESVESYKRALSIYTALCESGKPDSDMALTCNDLAIVYMKMQRYKEAEEMYLDSLKHYTGCFGPDHPDVAQALKNIGSFYMNPASRDKVKAVEYLKQSVETFSATLGISHERTGAARELLAMVQAQ